MILRITIFVFLVVIAGSVAAFSQDAPASPAIEEAFLAKDDGSGYAGETSTSFKPTDVPIHCIVLLDTMASATIKMNFVAVKVAGVKPETKVVTVSYTTREGSNKVNFTGRPDSKWTPGDYRVDLFVNGKIAKALNFEITGGTSAKPGSSFTGPADKPTAVPPKQRRHRNP